MLVKKKNRLCSSMCIRGPMHYCVWNWCKRKAVTVKNNLYTVSTYPPLPGPVWSVSLYNQPLSGYKVVPGMTGTPNNEKHPYIPVVPTRPKFGLLLPANSVFQLDMNFCKMAIDIQRDRQQLHVYRIRRLY